MPWYKIELTNTQVAEGRNLDIHDKFDKVWLANGCPEGFCLFSDEGSGEVATTYYFSPDSVVLMMKVINENNGAECSRPLSDEVTLEIGNVNDGKLLL